MSLNLSNVTSFSDIDFHQLYMHEAWPILLLGARKKWKFTTDFTKPCKLFRFPWSPLIYKYGHPLFKGCEKKKRYFASRSISFNSNSRFSLQKLNGNKIPLHLNLVLRVPIKQGLRKAPVCSPERVVLVDHVFLLSKWLLKLTWPKERGQSNSFSNKIIN